MRTLWVILLGGLALIETAEARLGESYEEIKTRIGSLQIKPHSEHPNELVIADAKTLGGFDSIGFVFFRKEGRSGQNADTSDISGKCIGVFYLKFYNDWDAVEMTPKDAGVLLAKNYPDSATNMQITESAGISGETAISRLWSVTWKGARGERASAEVSASDSDYTPIFAVFCYSPEWAKWLREKHDEKKKAKEQQRQRAMDAL